MTPNKTNFTKAITLLLFLLTINLISYAQESCDINQTLSIAKSIDLCGKGGIISLKITEGQAPFNILIKNKYTNQQGATTTNNRNLNLRLFPGTWTITSIDANGCEDVKLFNFYANNFKIETLECLENGKRLFKFKNDSSSFLPVTATISGFSINLPRGSSSNLTANEGFYTVSINRPGCNPYDVSFGIEACETTQSDRISKIAKQFKIKQGVPEQKKSEQKIIIDEVLDNSIEDIENLKAYPNPFTQSFTINLEAIYSKKGQVIIDDINGREVFRNSFNTSLNKTFSPNNLSSGIYFVKIVDEKGNIIKRSKIIKK